MGTCKLDHKHTHTHTHTHMLRHTHPLAGLRLVHREREGTENPPSQSQFHTFSVVVRPVRHGCLWIRAGQGLATLYCIEDRGISYTRTSILHSTKQVLSSVTSPLSTGWREPSLSASRSPLQEKTAFQLQRGRRWGDDRGRDQVREMDLITHKPTQTTTTTTTHFRPWDKHRPCCDRMGAFTGMKSPAKNSTSGRHLLLNNHSYICTHAHARKKTHPGQCFYQIFYFLKKATMRQ